MADWKFLLIPIHSFQDYWDSDSSEENAMYLQFSLILNDVSAFLVDGDYNWRETLTDVSSGQAQICNYFPVLDKCGIAIKLQQVSHLLDIASLFLLKAFEC